jgi:hypothetical protein
MASINDDTTHRCSMSSNPLGTAMCDDVCTQRDWLAEIAAHAECVINNERNSIVVSDVRDGSEIWNVELRVSDGLAVDSASIIVNGCSDVFGILTWNELAGNVELLHIDTELNQQVRYATA